MIESTVEAARIDRGINMVLKINCQLINKSASRALRLHPKILSGGSGVHCEDDDAQYRAEECNGSDHLIGSNLMHDDTLLYSEICLLRKSGNCAVSIVI